MVEVREIQFRQARRLLGEGFWPLLAIVFCCLSAVAVALVSQYYFDMQPCPWCVLQRAIFLVIALVCGVALIGRGRRLRLFCCSLALLLSGAGIASALWQHLGAKNSLSCGLSLAERIVFGLGLDRIAPEVMAPTTGCADGAVNLLGLPYEFWSLALFVIIAVVLTLMIVVGFRLSGTSIIQNEPR